MNEINFIIYLVYLFNIVMLKILLNGEKLHLIEIIILWVPISDI